jgi:hypothetical protein
MKKSLSALLGAATLVAGSVSAEDVEVFGVPIHGKIDVGPAYGHVTVHQNKKRLNNVDLYGARASATVIIGPGFMLKASTRFAKNLGQTFSAGGGIGWYIPVGEFHGKWAIAPHVDYQAGHLRVSTDLPSPPLPAAGRYTQGFHSRSESVAVDVTYSPCDKVSITQSAAYIWTQTRTTFEMGAVVFQVPRSESKGYNLSSQCDYWFDDNWSVHVAGSFDNSKNQERDGFYGYAFTTGIGYGF